MIIFTLGLVVLVATAAVSADTFRCYVCDDTSACNDPLDVSQVDAIQCDPFMSTLPAKYSLPRNILFKGLGDDEMECATVRGTNDVGKDQTMRLCVPAIIWEYAFCSWAEEALPYWEWENVTCSTCNTDLCNA